MSRSPAAQFRLKHRWGCTAAAVLSPGPPTSVNQNFTRRAVSVVSWSHSSDAIARCSLSELRFELDRLVSYDQDSILEEIRRVSVLLDAGVITRAAFDALSRVASSTCIRRFGGWQAALEAAGLGSRYSGRKVSQKMRSQRAQELTRDDVVGELRRIAAKTGRTSITLEDVRKHSYLLGERVIRSRLGSWKEALQAAGLELSPLGRRWSEDDYYENLLMVWTHYGRAPKYAEMDRPPSKITSGGYEARFGTWGAAKQAFVERVNRDLAVEQDQPSTTSIVARREKTPEATQETKRQPSMGLRYEVLRRDRFRCVLCGRSPATDPTCILHVDHVVPYSLGGETNSENLRSSCQECNIGKGNKID